MKAGYIILGIAIFAIVIGIFTLTGEKESKAPDVVVKKIIGSNIIEITEEGFSPKTLKISQGDTVTFINQGSEERWPATDLHPTHKLYPGSDIEKCGTPEESEIFDACKPLQKNEEYEFTFQEKGNWNYHDHLNPNIKGVIIVE